MKNLNTEGLVIRSGNYGEAHKLLTIFTPQGGKIPAIARGACKTKSKLAAGVQLFIRGDYLLYMGKTLATVTQAQIKNSFYPLREDLFKYSYGQYFCELVGRLLEERTPSPEIYWLLLWAFKVLQEGGEGEGEVLARSFELKLLSLSGYEPHLQGCLLCGEENTSYRFYYQEGGLVCLRCTPLEGVSRPISLGTCSLLKKLLTSDFNRLKVLKIPPSTRKEIAFINKKMLEHNMNLTFCRSLNFLEALPSPGDH